MKKLKHVKRFEQLENHDEFELNIYKEGIKLYEEAIENIIKAIEIFENSAWGIPEELDMLFGEQGGNENLWNLEKEVKHLKEESEDLN